MKGIVQIKETSPIVKFFRKRAKEMLVKEIKQEVLDIEFYNKYRVHYSPIGPHPLEELSIYAAKKEIAEGIKHLDLALDANLIDDVEKIGIRLGQLASVIRYAKPNTKSKKQKIDHTDEEKSVLIKPKAGKEPKYIDGIMI
jgi:hypothetical protein